MRDSNIQWCDGTINPAMGCDGCELWPTPGIIRAGIVSALLDIKLNLPNWLNLQSIVKTTVGERTTSQIYAERHVISAQISEIFGFPKPVTMVITNVIRKSCKCYAGLLGTMRAGHDGYADNFDLPKLFKGRVAKASRWRPPTVEDRLEKPWLKNAPLMIFLSDMGDCLSNGISFDFLQSEIINNVVSPSGQNKLWLWLTKRPQKMAEFATWLAAKQIPWPENLVAMTTITTQDKTYRINQLLKVPAKFRGLSCEPMSEPLTLNLTGIDWVIAGGGSDTLADPFDVEWALDLREQCQKTGVAFFLKQLGKNPMVGGEPIKLLHKHGGDWSEWPAGWKTRDIPPKFCKQ